MLYRDASLYYAHQSVEPLVNVLTLYVINLEFFVMQFVYMALNFVLQYQNAVIMCMIRLVGVWIISYVNPWQYAADMLVSVCKGFVIMSPIFVP